MGESNLSLIHKSNMSAGWRYGDVTPACGHLVFKIERVAGSRTASGKLGLILVLSFFVICLDRIRAQQEAALGMRDLEEDVSTKCKKEKSNQSLGPHAPRHPRFKDAAIRILRIIEDADKASYRIRRLDIGGRTLIVESPHQVADLRGVMGCACDLVLVLNFRRPGNSYALPIGVNSRRDYPRGYRWPVFASHGKVEAGGEACGNPD